MLYLLTGNIQSGKTRCLQREIERHEVAGGICYGVVSPGIWREQIDAASGQAHYEKLGIEALLLPENRRIVFARRRDLLAVAEKTGAFEQSRHAGLGWAISDTALDAVNRHFDALAQRSAAFGITTPAIAADSLAPASTSTPAVSTSTAPVALDPRFGILIVDELGPLELERGGGLVSAVRLLLAGPTLLWPDALVVVRSQLLDRACALLQPVWQKVSAVSSLGWSGADSALHF
jgi:hypothetical protein